ncbi:MAG: hypothetical protein ABW185_26165 [Sedimenticola sp.]
MADSENPSGPKTSTSTSSRGGDKLSTEKKGKAPAKATKRPVIGDEATKSNDNAEIMSYLKNIQAAQTASDAKLDGLNKRLEYLETNEADYEYDDMEYHSPLLALEGDDHVEPPPAKKQKTDIENSRFSKLSKRFRSVEVCDDDIDSVLAETVTGLFRKGMDDDQYMELVKDETTPRPNNCEGLTVVKTNQLVWDIMSPGARTNDRKLQTIESSVIKSATILAKMVNKVATIEKESADTDLGFVIDEGNDALALLGHANRQINMTRRDLLKPEMKNEYMHLCTHSLPYTNQLFGDDVSKTAKEIEDCAKIGQKMQTASSFSGRARARPGFRFRSRGFRGRGFRGRGAGFQYQTDQPKNSLRRGWSKGHPRM